MAAFNDSLRRYAFPIHKRDHFKCRYCGADGSQSFATWLTLSWDHSRYARTGRFAAKTTDGGRV